MDENTIEEVIKIIHAVAHDPTMNPEKLERIIRDEKAKADQGDEKETELYDAIEGVRTILFCLDDGFLLGEKLRKTMFAIQCADSFPTSENMDTLIKKANSMAKHLRAYEKKRTEFYEIVDSLDDQVIKRVRLE